MSLPTKAPARASRTFMRVPRMVSLGMQELNPVAVLGARTAPRTAREHEALSGGFKGRQRQQRLNSLGGVEVGVLGGRSVGNSSWMDMRSAPAARALIIGSWIHKIKILDPEKAAPTRTPVVEQIGLRGRKAGVLPGGVGPPLESGRRTLVAGVRRDDRAGAGP